MAAVAGLILIPFSLATPSRRTLALGVLTAILLALLLLIMHVIPSPFPGGPLRP
jgi:hypothetical protein